MVLVMLLPFSVFAGGAKEAPEEAAQRLEVLTPWIGADAKAIGGALDVFKAKFPDVDIRYTGIEANSLKTTVTTLLAGGMPPDALSWWSGQVLPLVEKDALLSLDDFWKDNDFDSLFPEGTREQFSTENGKVYFIPHVMQIRIVAYNKKMFDQYGLEPPKTWDDFLNIFSTLKDNDIMPMVVGAMGDVWGVSPIIDDLIQRTAGPDFMIRLGRGEESWTDPKVVEAFSIFADWLQKGYLNKDDMLSINFNDARARFGRGEAGMFYRETWVSAGLEENFNWTAGVDYAGFNWPALKSDVQPVALAFADGWVIPKDSANPELAKEFIKVMLSEEAQIAHTVTGKHGLSGLKSVKASQYDPFKESQKQTLDTGVTPLMNNVMSSDFLNDVFAPLISKMITEPENFREILAEIEAQKNL